MERERANIRNRFPDAYDEYSKNVPGFVPRPTPWRAAEPADGGGFSGALYEARRVEGRAHICARNGVACWRITPRGLSRCLRCGNDIARHRLRREDSCFSGMRSPRDSRSRPQPRKHSRAEVRPQISASQTMPRQQFFRPFPPASRDPSRRLPRAYGHK